MADEDYLSHGFDANSLTKPQLRSILAEHGVTDLPPVSAKKEVLVNMFDARIKARAHEIKAAASRVRPSALGIVMLDEQSRPSPSSSSKKTSPSKARKTPSSSPTSSPSTRAKTKTKLNLAEEALPRHSDSPASAKHKLSKRISTINTKLQAPSTMPFSFSGIKFPWTLLSDLTSLVVFFALLTAASFYLRWKFFHPFPYCDSGTSPQWSWAPAARQCFNVESWLEIMQTNCIACPAHGTCYDGRLTCQDGYVASPNLLALGGNCVPDRKKIWLIDQVAQLILKDLNRLSDNAYCTRQPEKRYLAIDQGFIEALKRKIPSVSDPSQFDALLKLALDDLRKNFHVKGERERLYVANARAPLVCKVRNNILALYMKYRFRIIVSAIALVATVALVAYIKWTLFYWSQVQDMTRAIFQMLAENASLHKRDFTVPAAIPIDQLRDAMLLTPKYKPFLKKRLFMLVWPQVVRNVSSNANVSETELHTRHRVVNQWEWIGMDIFGRRSIVEISSEPDEPLVNTPSKRYPKLL